MLTRSNTAYCYYHFEDKKENEDNKSLTHTQMYKQQ